MPEKTLPPEHWSLVCDAPYTGSADHRGLLQIRHPWVVSREGASAEWRTRASVPGEWAGGGPLFLSFYQSDNYAGARHEDASWLGVQAFRGHRFKQLLVNGQLLWEEDVAEEELGDPGAASSGYHDPYRVVRVPDDLGPEWEIVLRVVDRVASTTALDGDQYYRYSWGTADPEQTRHCFHTDVFFGDVALTTRPEPARPARRPSVRPAPAPPARALPPEGIPLPLQTPGNLPGAGYPVRCGVPLPEGLVPAGSLFALRDPAGRPAPAMVTETSHWRDGSVRWVLCEFPAAEAGVWHLLPGADPAPCPDPVRVRTDDGLVVENGRLSLRIGAAAGEGLFEEIVNGAARHLGAGRLSLKMNRVGWLEAFRGIRHEAVVERAGDVCAVIRLSGELLSTEGTRFGPWTARLQVWAGLPYVLIDWGLVNESDQAMAMILDWSAQFALPPGETPLADFGDFHTPTPEQWEADWWYRASPAKYSRENLRALPVTENSLYTCRQDTAELARIQAQLSWIGAARQAPGYVRLTRGGSTLVGAMRWFAEEFPKGIVVQPDALHLATLPEAAGGMAWAHDVPWVHMGRGEGKRQAMALWLSEEPLPPEDAGRFTACLNDPPRLFDSGWFVDAGVMECWRGGVF